MLGNFSYYNPTKLYFGDVSLTITQLGATEDMIPGITKGTICYPAGYLNLTKSDVTEILNESM